jgi:hypothetical protein
MEGSRYIIDISGLTVQFPTHRHPPEFWQALGRVVATFVFAEETLDKAIFAFTATRNYPESELEVAYEKWLPTLLRALSDPLGGLIQAYGNAAQNNNNLSTENFDEIIQDLTKAAQIGNVLCHGSLRSPDDYGRAIPFFVNKRNEVFDTAIDIEFLNKLQKSTTELICSVINAVTHMGYQFPGSAGPGVVIWQPQGKS